LDTGQANFRLEDEFADIDFTSKRLEDRFRRTMSTLFANPDKSIFISSESRAEAKAIYRMFNSPFFNIAEVKRSHRDATIKRIESLKPGVILAVQGTTGVNYANHKKTLGMGLFCDKTLGINLHTCLAVTPEGLVLGVLDQTTSTRPLEKASDPQKRSRDIHEKESYRWLETMQRSNAGLPANVKVFNVCDREGDIYELFEDAVRTDKLFLIRVAQNRQTTENTKIIDEIKAQATMGEVCVNLQRDTRNNIKARQVILEVRYARFSLKKPSRLNSKALRNSLPVNVIHVREKAESVEDPVEWILITNDAVTSVEDAFEKVGYYVQRWKIERFHYVLKSGCQVERIQERTYEKTAALLFMYSVIAVFLLNLTYMARVAPDVPCSALLNEEE
jgi:hypothetical protein